MAKLFHRYLWFVASMVTVGGISLLIWLHDEAHRQLRLRPTDILNSKLANEQLSLLQPNETSLRVGNLNQSRHTSTNKTPKPLKVFIYSLHSKFNKDIQACLISKKMESCFNLDNHGFGNLMYKEGDMAVYNTNQFSLEVIIHHQLVKSAYWTTNPEEADVFYIPAYMGTMFFCREKRKDLVPLEEEMFKIVKSMPYFQSGKPHISTLAKIEREMAAHGYPLLQNTDCHNVTYITIEKEARQAYSRLLGIRDQRLVVAPYPSYVHRNDTQATSQTISAPSLQSRKVFLFLAASTRRSNHFRAKILDQFKTLARGKSCNGFLDERKLTELPDQVMLVTHECYRDHLNITVEWMQNSVFCLQPHGDSPTRKSFYDSIQSGCIPVIFKFSFENVEYPFQKVLNYSDFTVSIDSSRIQTKNEIVINILKEIPPSEINRLHNNVLKVARQLQYSIPDVTKPKKYVDALDMIMDQVREIYDL